MAKKKHKKKSIGKKAKDGTAVVLGAAAADFLGDIASRLATDVVRHRFKDWWGDRDNGKEGDNDEDDVTARVLRVLADRGPQSIPDLMSQAKVGLTPLLSALQNSQQFKLVEFVGEGDLIKLTATGTRTATVVQQARIRREADKLLSE